MPNNKQLFSRWYPRYYDSRETQTYDIELFTDIFKGKHMKIFEVFCGTGRILLPLAECGHEMHGIDRDENMLCRLLEKSEDTQNIHLIKANAIEAAWGSDFDAVIMAGNLLLNIEDSSDPKSAQIKMINKSFAALKNGGYFILDNDCHKNPEKVFKNRTENIIRDLGTDKDGVSAKMNYMWSSYDTKTQICINYNRLELTAPDGEKHIKETKHINHIPSKEQMISWVNGAGFKILNIWGDHYKSPSTDETKRLIIFAQK